MAGELVTTLTNFHQTKYRDILNSDVPRASKFSMVVWNRARKIDLGGTSLNTTWAHQTAEGVGFGAMTEGGDYPAAGYDSAENPTLSMTHLAASVMWSGHALAAGNKTRYDGERLIRKKARALTEQIKKYVARMFMWDGTDILCQAGTVSGTTNGYFTIKSGGCPIHFFEPGQVVTFRDAASSGTEQLTNASTGGGRIVAIDPDLGRVYIADMTGGAADDYIAWANCYDATLPNGIRNLIDSGGTVMGINRANAAGAFLRSIEIDHASAAMNHSTVDELRDRVLDQAGLRGEKYATSWVGNRKMRRWATQATVGQNRFADLDLTLGIAQVHVNDKDGRKLFIEDEYIIDGELYAICPEKFVRGAPEGAEGGAEPVMNGQSPLFQATASSGVGYSDSQLQYVVWRGNLGIDEGRCHGKTTSIAAPV